MNARTIAEALAERIVASETFRSDFTGLERHVAETFLSGGLSRGYDASSISRLLRYADILSHSTVPRHRELSYATVALLRELDEMHGCKGEIKARIIAVSEAILIELGNFPGIETLVKGEGSTYALPASKGLTLAAKGMVQRTNRGDGVLTDTQYEIVSAMRDRDFFSFSGPTSLGKSFIIKDALYDLVRRDELKGRCVVVLVPTKALIAQTANDLRSLLADVPQVNVATYPNLPRLLQRKHDRTIFVLTPERLVRYLARPARDIRYLIVDEAQKIVAAKDSRSSLYYHAISQSIRQFATKLIFASPSIQNPEIFLELFGKETSGSLPVAERTVSQHRFLVDLVGRTNSYFSVLKETGEAVDIPAKSTSAIDLIASLSRKRKSIVYVNRVLNASAFALKLAERLPKKSDSELSGLASFVREYVHREYYLGQTLEHGVAFHHGQMPHEVRERIERAFADPESSLQFMICTSTLLEGVNLPAKNIFVLSDKRGGSRFSRLDFENLIGRAGRLTYDFSGNVVCVKDDLTRWSSEAEKLLEYVEPVSAESFMVQSSPRKKKQYTDMAKLLKGETLPGKPSADQQRNVQQYASVLLLHQLEDQQSPLRSLFLEKVDEGRAVLEDAAASIEVPHWILRRYPDIAPRYQNAVWLSVKDGGDRGLISAGTDLLTVDTFHDVLKRLSRLYNWRDVESRGRDPLVSRKSTQQAADRRLRYWAGLMRSWVRGDALSQVVADSIRYYSTLGKIKYRDFSRKGGWIEEPFNAESPKHINLVIEGLMRDIEGGLRYRIISYLQNFYDLSVEALGVEKAGRNVATLVEYGTSDSRSIELQEVGFSRSVAAEILREHSGFFHFSEDNELVGVDRGLFDLDALSEDARSEIQKILRWMVNGSSTGPEVEE